MKMQLCRRQSGMFLLEALIAILIFALGILGMIAMGGHAVSYTADAQHRADASNLANAIASEIALAVDRTSEATINTSLAQFAHQISGSYCAYSGAETTNAAVKTLLHAAGNSPDPTAGLPGADLTYQKIEVGTNPTDYNRVTITLCWKSPSDSYARNYQLITYVNGPK